MHGADSRAGQHRNGGFRHHRQVNEDPVALPDAVSLEHIREPAHFAMELLVSQHTLFAGFAIGRRFSFPDQRRPVRSGRVQPFVEAVVTDVEPPADEPFRERLLPLQHFLPGLEPDQFVPGLVGPKLLRRLHGLVVKLAILRQRADTGRFGKLFARLEHADFVENGSDVHRLVKFAHNIVSGRAILGG